MLLINTQMSAAAFFIQWSTVIENFHSSIHPVFLNTIPDVMQHVTDSEQTKVNLCSEAASNGLRCECMSVEYKRLVCK